MNLWIFHHYATLPNLNGQLRPYYFSQYLKKSQIAVTIFAASYQHLSDVDIITDNSRYQINNKFETPFVFIKTSSTKNGGIKRIKNMATFYFGLFNTTKSLSDERCKPDIIYASSPHPLTLIAGIKIAKQYKVPCICEIRDLWPEAIFKVTRIKEKSFLGKVLIKGEHWIYKNADELIFTKEGDTDYLRERKWLLDQGGEIDYAKCTYINNGVDLTVYNKQMKQHQLEDPDLKNERKFRIIYTGAIRKINNISNILDAADYLRNYKDIEFLIYGEGNESEEIKKRIADERLTNVKMKGFVEKKYIPFILNSSSVNLLNYSQSNYNWSRGNSSNKLFEYMASGKPIISTIKTGYSLISKYNCGIELEEDSPKALVNAIIKIKEMPSTDYNKMCMNAKKGAYEFDYKDLSIKLLKVMERAVNKGMVG